MSSIYDVTGNIIDLGIHDEAYYADIAKRKLRGKVLISFGDSYTYAMKSRYNNLATKYGMAHDGRGIVSSSISKATSNYMCDRVDTIASDYESGYVIDGVTYTKDDVALIVFMGGANDGPGIETGIGTGIHETLTDLIYGAMNKILNVLLETFTKSTVICVLQPSNYAITQETIDGWITSDEVAQRLGFDDRAEALLMTPIQLSNYCHGMKEKAVETAAWWYGVPILDMFHGFPTIFNSENRTKYWNEDKLHLTSAGYDFVINGVDKKIIEIFGAM